MTTQLSRLPSVLQSTGLRRSTLYNLIKAGKFPHPVKLSERCSAWRQSEVDNWIESRR